MDLSLIVMWLGFAMAAYSVVGNDVIQTLGTFLSSNEKKPWYVLWGFAGSILALVLIWGWIDADIAYGRLDKITIPETLAWWYLLPPLVLLTITRLGVPVSTTFLVLTLFSLDKIEGDSVAILSNIFDLDSTLGKMVKKSIMGYIIAFSAAGVIYLLITNWLEKRFLTIPIDKKGDTSIWTNKQFWTVAQWFSTAFLWSQWLTQDLANIYIYLLGKGNLDAVSFFVSLAIILGLLAYIFYSKGGAIQGIVKAKTNTDDIRTATFIDLIYGVILFIFKYNALGLWEGKLPMSTTWVFLGLLAGREYAVRYRLDGKLTTRLHKMIATDLVKVFAGLVVSVLLVFLIKLIS